MANGSRFDNPAALSWVLTGVSFVGGLATGLGLADAPFPQPGADVKDVQKFFQEDAGAEHAAAAQLDVRQERNRGSHDRNGDQQDRAREPGGDPDADVSRLLGRGRRGRRAVSP